MYHFCFVLLCIWWQFSKYKPPGGLYLEGRFSGGFFMLLVWGLIFGGAYTWRGLFSEFYSILPLSFLYYEYVSNLMHDINNNNTPLNILKLFQKTPQHTYSFTHNMRISTSVNFYVQSSRLEIHKSYFSRFGVKLWNKILCRLQNLPKKELKREICWLLLDIAGKENDYSRLPITRTFKGNRKRFELSGVRVIGSSKKIA